MKICESCHSGCCRNYAVGLTGYDILNIAKTLNVDPVSFVQIIPVKDENDIEYKSKYAALFRFTDVEDTFYLFGMRMTESQLVQGTIKCHFLLEWYLNPHKPSLDSIIARCGIYNCRPLTCSSFPYKLDTTEKFANVLDLTSNNNKGVHPVYNVCSRKITRDDLPESSDGILQDLVMRKYELEYFKDMAEYWNQKPGTIDEFLAFMKITYQNRVNVE